MSAMMQEEKTRASDWFRHLRDQIVAAFEQLEDTHLSGPMSQAAPGRFEITETRRASEDGSDAGGGLMSVMRGGRVFEKVGVNISTVHGTLGERARSRRRRDRRDRLRRLGLHPGRAPDSAPSPSPGSPVPNRPRAG